MFKSEGRGVEACSSGRGERWRLHSSERVERVEATFQRLC